MEKSCIVEQFKRYADLTEDECGLLDSLENEPRSFRAGETLRAEGEQVKCFYTLRSGWAYASRTLADGERQVLDIYLPGQIMGLREVGAGSALSNIVMLTEAEACPFPHSRLAEIFEQAPRLASLFFLALAQEESMLIERIVNISRRPADQRLAHFLIEMKLRLHKTCDEFELPMNQTVIGDALGLTAVHVSRTFKRLRDEGLVCMEEGTVKVSDANGLIQFCGFNPAYLGQNVELSRRQMKAAAI